MLHPISEINMTYTTEESLLRITLNNFHSLTDEEFDQFLEVCEFKEIKRKEFVLRQGNYNHGISFVISGAVGLYETIDGRDMYQNFFMENEFAFELKSLTTKTTTVKNLVALSDTKYFFLNRGKLLSLYDLSTSVERLGRKLLEHLLEKQSEISYVLQCLKPEKRYEFLEKHRPKLLRQIPLTYLASYLGLARETLSRIRSKR